MTDSGGSPKAAEDEQSVEMAMALAKEKEKRLAALQYMVPSAAAEYHMKSAYVEFLLEEDDLVGVAARTVRNPGKPYPDRYYKGADLITAAKKKFGGLEEFVIQLKKHAKCYVADPMHTPPIRYIVLIPTEDQMRAARQNMGMFLVAKSADQEKLMSLFQEADQVVLLIAPTHNRGFKTWGVMEMMPDITGYCKIDLNEDTHVSFRDVPHVYDDQVECFNLDMKELPPDLGHQVVVSLAGAVFDRQIGDKRRAERSSRKRSRSRSRSRSRDRHRERERERQREIERPRTRSPEIMLHPTSLNLTNFPAGLSFEEQQKLEAKRVIEKRKRQGFYL